MDNSLPANQPAARTPQTQPQQTTTPQKTTPAATATPPKKHKPKASYPNLNPEDKQATQKINQGWKTVLKQVRINDPKIHALLLSTTSQYMKGNELVLCFSSEVVKNMLDKESNIEVVKTVAEKVYQRNLNIKCIVDTSKHNSVPQDVDENGMVATALRDLGGEIVDVK